MTSQQKKLVLQRAGFKKIKFNIEADEVTVYNQLEGLSHRRILWVAKLLRYWLNDLHTKLQGFRTSGLQNAS